MSCNSHTLAALSVDSDWNKARVGVQEGSLLQFMPAESSSGPGLIDMQASNSRHKQSKAIEHSVKHAVWSTRLPSGSI